ncbi:hypothetical protein BJX64DRAFT_247655 [Aspergillus heterothallicus]
MASPSQRQRPTTVSEPTTRLTLDLTGWRKLFARVADWPSNAIALTIKREEDGSD